jgi:hypothetical protein
MPSTSSPGTAYDMLLLAFAGGFALATLIFLPMLHRAQNRFALDGTPRRSIGRGKHARRAADSEQSKIASNSGGGTTAPIPAPAKQKAAAKQDAPVKQAPAKEKVSAPQNRTEDEPAPVPKNLYHEHHAAQFDRMHQRLARLRSQIDDL